MQETAIPRGIKHHATESNGIQEVALLYGEVKQTGPENEDKERCTVL